MSSPRLPGQARSAARSLDSVADRVSDGFIFSGVAWYFLDGRDPRAAIIPIAILAVSGIVSYTRAKGELLGFVSGRGGLMERAERLILLGVALALHVILIPLLIVLLTLTSATAMGGSRRVWREASDAPVRQRPALGGAWRGWREQRAPGLRGGAAVESCSPSRRALRGVLGAQGSVSPRMKRTSSGRPRNEHGASSALRN